MRKNSIAVETLTKARVIWPEVVTAQYLNRFILDGTLTTEEVNQILKED